MKSLWVFIFSILITPGFAQATTFSSGPQVCGLVERARLAMSVVASNLANVNTTRTPEGGAYLVLDVECVNEGCEVQRIAKIKRVYEPQHIDADGHGYVAYPDIDIEDEVAQMHMLAQIYEKALKDCAIERGASPLQNDGVVKLR